MRVLSFLPAVFLAAVGFAAAAPSASVDPGAPSVAGLVGSLQNSTSCLQPITKKLTTVVEGNIDVKTASSLLNQVTGILNDVQVALKADIGLSLTGDLTSLGVAIEAFLKLQLTVLGCILSIAKGNVNTLLQLGAENSALLSVATTVLATVCTIVGTNLSDCVAGLLEVVTALLAVCVQVVVALGVKVQV